MPGIVALAVLFSLDATTTLVANGYGLTPLTVTGASNATPIVIETAEPHGVRTGLSIHLVVAGVVGNTAANNVDATDGVTNNAWVASPTDPTHLALYNMSPTGALVASTGSGAYVSGGTATAAFTDGRILLGREHIYEQSAPPRVVFVPTVGKFAGKDVYNASLTAGYPSAEVRRQNQLRSIRAEHTLFEVHVWGAAVTPDPADDFDATQVLYHQVIRTAQVIAAGTYELSDGRWMDQDANASQLVKSGHEFVFGLALGTPVLDRLIPYAPSNVAPDPTTQMSPFDGGAPETGCTG